MSDALKDARALLEADGYVVLRRKSYDQAQTRHAIARREVEWAERSAEHARQWARDCITEERRLRGRCQFLYGLAKAKGATDDELRGPG